MIEYEGLFKDDIGTDDCRIGWSEKSILVLCGCVESLTIGNGFNPPDLSSLILKSSLLSLKRIEIGNDCFKEVTRFVIDGLNELKSVNIGKESFHQDDDDLIRNECVIMNCDQLNEIHFGKCSFFWYESFELKNLPSLISIQLDDCVFDQCNLIVFDSMND